MRILHIDSESGFRGGEAQVRLLARGLRARGHEQLIVGRPGGAFLSAMLGEDFETAELAGGKILGARRTLRRIADAFRPDIVHAHTGNAHTLAFAALHGRVPIVVTRRVDFALKRNPLSRRKYLADGIRFIAISSAVKTALIAGGVPEDRIDLVYSGVDPARVTGGNGTHLRAKWLGGDEGPLIGFVGALVDHKAPWVLAEAAARVRESLPGARVIFVGDGESRQRIEGIRAAHPETIHLAGWRDDIADCYAALDLFVMPSKEEGLCTAAIDALAAGVPSVVSRAGGLVDVVEDAVTGVTVEPLNAKALANAIVELWNNPSRRAEFSRAGIEKVARQFTADSMVEGTLRVYEKM